MPLTRRPILQKAGGQSCKQLLPLLVSQRFQVLFHSPRRGSFHLSLTVLVRYRSPNVFSLGGWSPLLPTGLACPVVLRVSAPHTPVRLPGCHRLRPAFPEPFDLRGPGFRAALQPPPACRRVWATPLSLATTRGIVSFPPGTEMFQFPGFPSDGYVFTAGCVGMPPRGFPHSDISGSCGCTPLTRAFRSVPRPSSAFGAKASTVRSS